MYKWAVNLALRAHRYFYQTSLLATQIVCISIGSSKHHIFIATRSAIEGKLSTIS